jgi:hypothetical protein
MSTVLAQILDRVDVVLKANVPNGTGVYRDRADAESLREVPCVNALVKDDSIVSFAAELDVHQVQLELRIAVRAEPGTPAAETVHASFHPALVADSVLASLCESRRIEGGSFDLQEADTTSLIKVARYRFTYSIPHNTL